MKNWSIIIFYLAFITASAQEYSREDIDPSIIADELAAYHDEDGNYDDLYENYLQLFSNPIDLNYASEEQLRSLQILSEFQIINLIKHLNEHRPLLTIYELQAIPHFDLGTIYKLLPFVVVSDEKTKLNRNFLRRIVRANNTYFVTRFETVLEESKGYSVEDSASRFLGSNNKLYTRFRTSMANDFSFGFTAEKDAGEKFGIDRKNHLYGMDFFSYHAQIQNKKRIKNIVLGDFQCQFGQGLVLGNAFGLGKGGETVNTTRKANIGFLPYTSVNESGYLRGGAITYMLHKNIHLSLYYSNTLRDANIQYDSILSFSGIVATGYHRNAKELADRKVLREKNYGSVLEYHSRNLNVGVTAQEIGFDAPVQKNTNAYNQNSFEGTSNLNGSVFASWNIFNVSFFGEFARSFSGGTALLAGALASVDPKLDISLLFRKYDTNYYPFYANGFAENTVTRNESGMYWGAKYRINKKYSIAAYADVFSFPWLKFRTYKPSNGNEMLLRFNYQPAKKIMLFIQFRQEEKERNVQDDTNNYVTASGLKRNLWLNADYSVSDNIKLKSRCQASTFDFTDKQTAGLALIQDVIIKVNKTKITARYALMDTDDFDNRQYVYENDVWLAYTLPAYFGKGVRSVLMIEQKLNKHLTVWLRGAQVQYIDQEAIGSGYDIIDGKTKTEIKCQLRWSL